MRFEEIGFEISLFLSLSLKSFDTFPKDFGFSCGVQTLFMYRCIDFFLFFFLNKFTICHPLPVRGFVFRMNFKFVEREREREREREISIRFDKKFEVYIEIKI